MIHRARPRRAKSAAAASASFLPLVVETLDDNKAEEIVSIPLADKTSLADFMVVASGRSQRHVGAIADKLLHKLKEAGVHGTRVEGMPLGIGSYRCGRYRHPYLPPRSPGLLQHRKDVGVRQAEAGSGAIALWRAGGWNENLDSGRRPAQERR